MEEDFQVSGTNDNALFTLKLHRGDGMTLIAMNWKNDEPPTDFVGFGIEYKEPEGIKFFALKNRLAFLNTDDSIDPNRLSTLRSPIQKFRWVHFPRNAELPGEFTYRITPVFMNTSDELSFGESQMASIQLRRETYPGLLNVTFTRGFVSSQAFVNRYGEDSIPLLLPPNADSGLNFVPTHPKSDEALAWMGFEARNAILEVLDKAIEDDEAEVRVVAYDLSEPGIVSRLEKIGSRLKVIIDDSGTHGDEDSGETQATNRLIQSAGEDNVRRQHMGGLQHNKTIVVDGTTEKVAVCGSTNFSWRGFFVQSNNAIILKGQNAIKPFLAAFDEYWDNSNSASAFGTSPSSEWVNLNIQNINAEVSFSPHSDDNALLKSIADDIEENTTSSLFYSLAFLFQTPGVMQNAILKVSKAEDIFVYGISDKEVGGIDLQDPDGNVSPVFPAALTGANVPEPFKSEPAGGGGNRMHHKFLVVDFDKPTARVYMGSYNFSIAADDKNGENLLLIKDQRIAVSYMIEAVRLFDHYHFRVIQKKAQEANKRLFLQKPPQENDEKPWWSEDYTHPRKIRDRVYIPMMIPPFSDDGIPPIRGTNK